MAKIKHNPEASKLIDEYISQAQPFAQKICNKLRQIIKKTSKEIIEDWKWGPHYYREGMLCGYGAFKEHVNFVFFQGAMMKDPNNLFNYGDSNQHNKSIKFTDVKQIDEKIITAYIKEALANNLKGIRSEKKEIKIPEDMRKALNKANVLDKFERYPYTHRKEWIDSVIQAKKPETRERRIEKAVEKLLSK